MRNVIISFLFLAFALPLQAVDIEQRAEELKNDPTYLVGEGWGETFNSADQAALSNLISKISVNLSSSFDIKESEYNSDGNYRSESAIQSVVKSYSQASLANTETLVISNEPDAHILRYVKRDDVKKIFDGRKDKIANYVRSGQRAVKKLKIDDALRSFYWAFCLLKSVQYPNEVTFTDEEGNAHQLMTWLPELIDDVLKNVDIKVAGQEENDVNIYVTYGGQPVVSAEYSYFDGQRWSNLFAAKDGKGVLELRPGLQPETFQVRFEYEYLGEAQIDDEIESVMELFKGTAFRAATKIINKDKKDGLAVDRKAMVAFNDNSTDNVESMAVMENKESKDYASVIDGIVKAIDTRNFASADQYFTEDGLEMYHKLLTYGKARVLGKADLQYFHVNDKVICRSLPMSFSFSNNNRTFVEDVTFTFNADSKIENVSFGLGSEANKDILNQGVGIWPDEVKLQIAMFLENYKTAFALKRLDYIESIFDDNAIIITGNVLKKANVPEDNQYIDNQYVTYTRHSKQEYLKNLARCFKSSQYINIRFANNDVVRMGAGGEVYGIQIEQDYYSSSYGDHGYLFLLVDMNDPEAPVIKVRTWQPNRDPDVNSRLPKDDPSWGLIGAGNF